MPTIRTPVVGRILAVFLATTLGTTLAVPAPPAAHAAGVGIGRLTLVKDISAPTRDTPAPPEQLHLATVSGIAFLNPSPPITRTSMIPTSRRRAAAPARRPAPRIRAQPGMTFTVITTAYSSTPDQTDGNPFITASGTHVHDGTLAANFLPIGTRVTFPDYSGGKTYVVEDRTSSRYSSRADIWMPSRQAALAFGKRTLTMVVVE